MDSKTQSLIRHVESVEYIATDNEVEAFILENTLVKKYQPKYNIDLKDAKSYAFIHLTDEEFPRVLLARGKTGKGKFYGPFVSAQELNYILHFLKKTFALRTCKKLPKKPCLRYHINLCDAPCAGFINHEDYNRKIDKVKLVLSGNEKKLKKQSQKEMKNHSKKSHFEKALKIRDEIIAIERLNERQNMQRQKKYNEDIINYKIKDEKVYLMIFNIYKGTLSNKNEYVFDYNDDFLEEFIIQYYSENPIPKEIIVSNKINESIASFLEIKKGKKVKITKPQKGEKKQLLDLVIKNIEIAFFADTDKVDALKTKLKLHETPVIRTVEGIDDFAAIAEVVKRRYTRLKNEDVEFPNLIVIDGGRGQLNFALQEIEKLNLKIPIISIAKQFEEIYIPGMIHPLRLAKTEKALKYIQEIRDEAHRFAIKYNRLLRKKELIS